MRAPDPAEPVRAGPAGEKRRKPKKASSPVQREGRVGYLFLLPWFIGMVAFTIGPILGSLYLSFTKYPLLKPPEWIGPANFERMLEDPRLHKALWNTVQYVFVSVPLQLVLALALALLLNRGVRGLAFYRSVYYLPSLLASSVSIAILWRQIFGADGLIN